MTGMALIGAIVSSCGGSSSNVVRSVTPSVSASTPTAASTAPRASSSSAARPARPTVIVLPARGLQDRQTVRVSGAGFTPGEALQVIQCADNGTNTGPGDCNLTGMVPAMSDAGGRVSTALTVLRGPFGSNNIICAGAQRCLISVTQASLTPTEEADASITFAGG